MKNQTLTDYLENRTPAENVLGTIVIDADGQEAVLVHYNGHYDADLITLFYKDQKNNPGVRTSQRQYGKWDQVIVREFNHEAVNTALQSFFK